MNNDFIKKILILLYGVVIIGSFLFLSIEHIILPTSGIPPESTQYLLSAVSIQLGMLTAWLFGNNNKKK